MEIVYIFIFIKWKRQAQEQQTTNTMGGSETVVMSWVVRVNIGVHTGVLACRVYKPRINQSDMKSDENYEYECEMPDKRLPIPAQHGRDSRTEPQKNDVQMERRWKMANAMWWKVIDVKTREQKEESKENRANLCGWRGWRAHALRRPTANNTFFRRACFLWIAIPLPLSLSLPLLLLLFT